MHPSNAEISNHRRELGDMIKEAARWIGRVGKVVSSEPGYRDVDEVDDQGRRAEAVVAQRTTPSAAGGVAASAPPGLEWWEVGGIKVGHASHRVWVVGQFVACLRCGAYMSSEARRAYKLHAPCSGAPPNPSAALRLKRLRQGHHPLEDRFIEAPRLSRIEGELRALEAGAAAVENAAEASAGSATAPSEAGAIASGMREGENSGPQEAPGVRTGYVADIAALYGYSFRSTDHQAVTPSTQDRGSSHAPLFSGSSHAPPPMRCD